MCFRRSRYWEERAAETGEPRVWDLFYRETERSEPPLPVAESDEAQLAEHDRDEVPVGAER